MAKNNSMVTTFANNIRKNYKQLADLLATYDLAKLGYEMEEQQSTDAFNQALKESVYKASSDCPRADIKKGDRITDELYSFLLNEKDFDAANKRHAEILHALGVCDEEGTLYHSMLQEKGTARRELINFYVANIMPPVYGRQFQNAIKENTLNIVQEEKLLDIIRRTVSVPDKNA